jgi:hypothetical protein
LVDWQARDAIELLECGAFVAIVIYHGLKRRPRP